jgi:hypothetical protein
VKEVERRLRVPTSVMKFITVRIDEKLKKIDKRKKAAREAGRAQACAVGGARRFHAASDGDARAAGWT